MNNRPEIISVEGRTPIGDGVSRPFRCIDSTGRIFYVKLKNVGYDHLVKEWVCGRLAQEMGLRCASVSQVSIPRMLVEGSPELERELGAGIAFGSEVVPNTVTLASEHVRNGDGGKLGRILMFDWWTRNSDRSLSDMGGNPNLLWALDKKEVVMIDHDNAFDDLFLFKDIWEGHALRSHTGAWGSDERGEMERWLEAGLSKLDAIWNELPEEWLEDEYGDVRLTFDKSDINAILSLPFRTPEVFWKLPHQP